GAALFIPAGSIAWPGGWAFLLLFLSFVIAISIWLLRVNPDLLAERMTGIGRPGQGTWDKVFLGLVAIVFFAWLVLMGLDAVRFRWSHIGPGLQIIGALLLL